MRRRLATLFLAALFCAPAHAEDEVVQFVAPENLSMPLAVFQDGKLTGGIIKELADQPVAITMGYHYARVERALGSHLLRDEAPSVDLDLQKVAKGRVRYALVNKLAYDYAIRSHPEWNLRADLVFDPISASCAFSFKSPLRFRKVSDAIDALIADGRVSAILDKYR